MRWTLTKLDSLVGTVLAATAGLAASQLQAFIHAYLYRLGGHLDEARRTHEWIVEDARGAGEAATQTRLAEIASARVGELQSAYDAITTAGVFSRPLVFFTRLDDDIARATWRTFEPSLPLDTASLAYGIAGMVVAWMVYEIVKLPVVIPMRRRLRVGSHG